MNHSYLEYTPPNPDQNYLRTSGSSLQVNMRFKGVGENIISIQHWSTIGDPMEVLLETPPDSYWRPPDFYGRPKLFIGDPIFIGDPQGFIVDLTLYLGDPIFSFQTPYFRLTSNEKIGVSNENMGISNENHGGLQRYVHVGLQ